MQEQQILDAFTHILRDLLSDQTVVLSMETVRERVPGWDSFAYISFIVAVEMEFRVKFGVAEVESFENVGAVVRRTQSALASGLIAVDQELLRRAVQLLRVHLSVPARDPGGLLPAWARVTHVGAALADRRLAVLLCVVAPDQRAHNRAIDPRQLLPGQDAGSAQGAATFRGGGDSVLLLGIAFNIAFLGYFKYANFFMGTANDLFGAGLVFTQIILPLGISFITFQKIAFLIDVHSGRVEGFTLQDYCPLRAVFPTADRRTDSALPRNDAAIPAGDVQLQPGECCSRRDSPCFRPLQEGRPGRPGHRPDGRVTL